MRFTPILAAVALGATQLANAQGIVINCTWQNALLEDNFLGMYCNNDDWAHFAYDWTWQVSPERLDPRCAWLKICALKARYERLLDELWG